MLVHIFLIDSYNGVSAGQYTQVSAEIAEQLIQEGKATNVESTNKEKTETKKVGK